jgi:4-alpha-glucanotransferase
MSVRAELEDLAQAIGIATSYTDALGERRTVSQGALRALIAALGFPPDPAAARERFESLERARPLGLAAAHVVPAEAENPELPLRLPDQAAAVEWALALEDGGEISGKLSPEALEHSVLPLPAGLALGYHRLAVKAGGAEAAITLIVAPPSCWLPPELGPGARSWGLTCQLYGVHGGRDWGIGDFSDLAALAQTAGRYGAAVLGVNPLHALFAAEPRHISPYSPSSRVRLDYLYVDVTAVPGFSEDERARSLADPTRLAAARQGELVDYDAVAACKRPVLEALYDRFHDRDLAGMSPLGREFREFQADGGSELLDFATFEALHEHWLRQGSGFSWRGWPAAMRDPHSVAVRGFAAAHRDRVEFFQFLQFIADRQLEAASTAGQEAGLSIGLYRDLAVGADPHGAEAWADQELVAPGAAIGAPPDALSRMGQNWGLAPVNPLVLRERSYRPFVASLRANMRHAGILRIDHAMSLSRLYWVPEGMTAKDGGYVRYPFEDLVRLVALESHRQRCAVIGEDLGTVPEGFRERMQSANLLSYRIAAFERDHEGRFVPPAEYPALAAATAATHDMPTIKGSWLGRDIDWRRRLGLYPDEAAAERDTEERYRDRRRWLEALAAAGLFAAADADIPYTAALSEAILAYMAGARARLFLVQLEDIAGMSEQANLPGTTEDHPNWRRRLALSLEELIDGPELRRAAQAIGAARYRSTGG